MNVISLFDGCAMARVALDRAGFDVKTYLSCEVDKYAIKVAEKNWPMNIHMGDVTEFSIDNLEGNCDLLIGGSPCQDLSVASPDRKGLEGARSGLFWEYVRILHEVKPKYFLLENVRMSKDNRDIISRELGVEPIEIDSALFSAQTRKRLYWTNIPLGDLPEDKGVVLSDILECQSTDYIKVAKRGTYKTKQHKASCLSGGAHSGGNHSDMDLIGVHKTKFNQPVEVGHADDIKGHDFLRRVYSTWGKSPTLTTVSGGNQHRKVATSDYEYRRLTPTECERLQTLPDGYTEGVSNTQRYKMLGNGFTVDVIAWLLSGMKTT